ncbi:MAG: FtsX-like permease family protein, partial [Candidatus Aminicenantes bacterium]|nr:FtsX-like permease family protein [Candidatus Aminicenantes bacterium]
GQTMEYFLQPVTDIHLHSTLSDEIAPQGNILYVYVFSIVALFILIIACINFMNLSTARSAGRGMEVGIRKVFGARKNSLIRQFVSESVFIAFLGLLTAVGLALLLLPTFNGLTEKSLSTSALFHPGMILGFLGLVCFTGLLAGFYPAFILSAYQPIEVLRSRIFRRRGGAGLRNGLVTFQFVISVFLIISTFIVLSQIGYMKHASLGFDKEQVLVLRLRGSGFQSGYESFKNMLLQNPSILNASFSDGVPGDVNHVLTTFQEGKNDKESHTFYSVNAGLDFLDTFGISLAGGRAFSSEHVADANGAFLINETAARKLGWGEDTIGKRIGFDREKMAPIVGIVKDFHFRSLHEEIAPLALYFSADFEGRLSLRLRTDDLKATISYIEDTWKRFEKERMPAYYFVDERFDALYRAEERLSRIILIFSVLAVFVACLGLFGLASYTVQQSSKEIGIRRVLGASVQNIVVRLSRNFLRWVLLANLIAWPAAYYVMKMHWLRNFPFRVGISPLLFVGAGLLSLLIAVMTVSFQSVRAAVANPIDSLRME